MMEMKGKTTIILIILISLSLILAAGGFYLLQQEKKKTVVLQENLEESETRAKLKERQLEESNKKITQLESQLQEAKAQIETLNSDIQKEKASKEEALGQFDQLKAELEQQKTLRQDIEKKLEEAQADLKTAQKQFKDLESRKNLLEGKLKELESQALEQARMQELGQEQNVELGKIVVAPEEQATLGQAGTKAGAEKAKKKPVVKAPTKVTTTALESEGKVLVLNKEYNFTVINLGSKDGVNIGDTFSVYHANKYMGDIKVEKVHDSMAAAGFVTKGIKEKIGEGDRVVQKK